jgi:HAD superfamily hydrolase (TIGR01509 family)
MTTTAVLFDMDGVLVDSTPLHVRAYEQVFREVGIEFSDAARTAVHEGKPRSEVIEIGAPGASSALKRRLFDAKPNAVAKVLAGGRDVSMPGATRTVRALTEGGIPMGVVTNSGTPNMWLEAAGLLEQVNVVVASDDVSLPKPSPEGYLLAARLLDVNPAHCIAFEDSHDGWLAATRAGMRVMIVGKTRPIWVTADTEMVQSMDAPGILKLCLHATAGEIS